MFCSLDERADLPPRHAAQPSPCQLIDIPHQQLIKRHDPITRGVSKFATSTSGARLCGWPVNTRIFGRQFFA